MTTKTYTFMDHVMEHIPDLKDLVSKYLKYDYIMTGCQAHPQKQAKDYDPNDESQFLFEVDDPLVRDTERVIFIATKENVRVLAIYEHGEEGEFSEEHTMTHEDCLAYLAQLPKTWHHFTTDEEEKE